MEWTVPYLPHAYVIELLALIAAIVGTSANARSLYDAVIDKLLTTRNKVNGIKGYTASTNLEEEFGRMLMNLLFLYAGVISVTHGPPDGIPLADDRFYQLLVSRVAMTVSSSILAYQSIRVIQKRRRLLEILDLAEVAARLGIGSGPDTH